MKQVKSVELEPIAALNMKPNPYRKLRSHTKLGIVVTASLESGNQLRRFFKNEREARLWIDSLFNSGRMLLH